MKGKKTGGRKKGDKNKATLQIKELLDSNVDFEIVITKLYELTKGVSIEKTITEGVKVIYEEKPDSNAAKILLAYRFGAPKQEVDNNIKFAKPLIIDWSDDKSAGSDNNTPDSQAEGS